MQREKKKALIEWTLASILLFFVVKESPYFNYYHLSPLEAHKQSERTFYYGPSEVVEEIDFGDAQVFLGIYKDWFSANMVVKHKGIFWAPGSGIGGTEIKKDQDISHSWSGSSINEDFMLMKFYGIVSNPDIVKVELDVIEGYHNSANAENEVLTLSYILNDHRMFIFHWNEVEHEYKWISLRGLNRNGDIVYEEEY